MSIDAMIFAAEGIHAIDMATYDEPTNAVLCYRCSNRVDANAWAKPCPGAKRPVAGPVGEAMHQASAESQAGSARGALQA